MTCSSRAQICYKPCIRDSRRSSTEVDSDFFCYLLSLFARRPKMTKANGKKKDGKKAEHAKKQREKQKEETQYWAIKLMQWRANKAEKNLSNKASFGSFSDEMGFRVAVANSTHLSWHKVCMRASRMKKKQEEQKAVKEAAVQEPKETVGRTTGSTNEAAVQEPKQTVGRPTGSTNEATIDVDKRKKGALVALTERYKSARDSTNKRLVNGTYKKLHDEVLKEFNLDQLDFQIKQDTVGRRMRNNTTRTKRGPDSPAASIEPYLVTFANYRQEAGQPMSKSELLELGNKMLKGSAIEGDIMRFHERRKQNPEEMLGNTWYNSFMNRNNHVINSGRGRRQHTARKVWTTFDNIDDMYELMYKHMIDARIAEHLPEEEGYWVDEHGNKVEKEEDAAGHKCTAKLIHPEYLLFGDEVGTDTAQDKDGHIGGQTYLSVGDRQINLESSKATNRFTVIGLTAATGDPVMCIVIIAGKELTLHDALGYDHQAESAFDPNIPFEDNIGPGKAFPNLPSCEFRGKTVPGFLAMTPKGSITSDILAASLKRLDDLGVYERTENGPTPMVLLDGHESRLQLPFLEYVNSKNAFNKPMWKACIGLPNGTAKWQVGDSKQQNGAWKISMTKNKDKLVLYKKRYNFASIDFKRHDIIPLVNRAWADSFARKESNLKAITERGWYHLDRRLLKDPEILQTRTSTINWVDTHQHDADKNEGVPAAIDCNGQGTVSVSSDLTPRSNFNELAFNFDSPIASEYLNDLIQHGMKSQKLKEFRAKRVREIAEKRTTFEKAIKETRLTAGLCSQFGETALNEKLLESRRFLIRREERKKQLSLESAKKRYYDRMEKYNELFPSGQETSKKSVSHLKIWLQVRKMKEDPKLPTTRAALLRLQDEWSERPVIPLRQYLKDLGKEEKDIDEMLLQTSNEEEGKATGNLQLPMNESVMKDDEVDNICEQARVSENFI